MAQARPKPKERNWVLTSAEARALFDEEARRLLGISGEEFLRAWEAGEFDDDPDRRGVIELSLLLPWYCSSQT